MKNRHTLPYSFIKGRLTTWNENSIFNTISPSRQANISQETIMSLPYFNRNYMVSRQLFSFYTAHIFI